MSKRNQVLLAILIIVAVAAGLAVLRSRSTQKFARPEVKKNILPAFAIADAKRFSWHVGTDSWNFSRASENGLWTPALGHQVDIEGRLRDLAEMEYAPVDTSAKSLVRVVIGFGSGPDWVGFWTGDVFFWKIGPLAGKGFSTNTPYKTGIFTAGHFAFLKREITWCQSRILEILVKSRDLEMRLYRDGTRWILVRGGIREVDPNAVENWFGKNCVLKADHYIDPAISAKADLEMGGEIEVEFENKTKTKISKKPNSNIFSIGHVFRSTQFQEGLAQLASLPSAPRR